MHTSTEAARNEAGAHLAALEELAGTYAYLTYPKIRDALAYAKVAITERIHAAEVPPPAPPVVVVDTRIDGLPFVVTDRPMDVLLIEARDDANEDDELLAVPNISNPNAPAEVCRVIATRPVGGEHWVTAVLERRNTYPLTLEQYITRGGGTCPRCGSTDLMRDSVDIEEGGAAQKVSCNTCDHEWTDRYVLSGMAEN